MSTTTAPGSVLHGRALVRDSHLNRGTALTVEERSAFGLEGLLPSGVLSLEEQAKRSYEQYGAPRPHCWLPTLSSDPCAANLFGAVFSGRPVSSASVAAISSPNPSRAFRPVPTAVPRGHRPGRAPRVDGDLRRRRARRERGERAPVTRPNARIPRRPRPTTRSRAPRQWSSA